MIGRKNENIEIHFVLLGFHFEKERLRSFILKGMKKYQIKKVTVTEFNLLRRYLITKETMENYFKGKRFITKSVNDEIESFFEKIRLGEETNDDHDFYFFPRLSEEEMELVERKDDNFMNTFFYTQLSQLGLDRDADVAEARMKASESDSKYVDCYGNRKSLTIKN